MNTLIAEAFLRAKEDRDDLIHALRDVLALVHPASRAAGDLVKDAQRLIERCESHKGTEA